VHSDDNYKASSCIYRYYSKSQRRSEWPKFITTQLMQLSQYANNTPPYQIQLLLYREGQLYIHTHTRVRKYASLIQKPLYRNL